MLPADEGAGFLRTSARVSVVTGVARITGFARYIVLGLAVGTTYLGNTYETANWIPNIVFELAAGGVLSAVFVPTFVRSLEHGRERSIEIASSLANTFLLLSIPVVVIGALAAEPIMRLMTIAVEDPAIREAQIRTGSWFLYVFLPQVPFYVLAMVWTGILHAHRRFLAPAAAPLFSSLVVISAYLTFGALGAGAELGTVTPVQRYVLAGGTTAGVFVLAFSQLPSVLRTGIRWRPVLGWNDPAVRRALRA
ncbi:MAG: virulence factor MviN, partial [Actinobacteria bacterium]|nr:virulence factor MviN [Actinomycetota bacterium]